MVDSPTGSRGGGVTVTRLKRCLGRLCRTDSGRGTQFHIGTTPFSLTSERAPGPAASIMRSRMRAHELTTSRREGVRTAGPRALRGAPARLDSRGAAPPLSCDLFRSAGIVPGPVGAIEPRTGVDLSRRSPPHG
jgi:hypothetical protein